MSWLTQTSNAFPSSLNALTEQYQNDAWVDWAQTVLLKAAILLIWPTPLGGV